MNADALLFAFRMSDLQRQCVEMINKRQPFVLTITYTGKEIKDSIREANNDSTITANK